MLASSWLNFKTLARIGSRRSYATVITRRHIMTPKIKTQRDLLLITII